LSVLRGLDFVSFDDHSKWHVQCLEVAATAADFVSLRVAELLKVFGAFGFANKVKRGIG